jgi:predicted HTH transcriptional regulator
VAKPIPSYQTYKGTVFELVDQAVDFVLSKIDCAVGTRAHSTQAPVEYEIPPEVVREAIVNAVAHRDYASTGSVQVMLFSDRLEVWNPAILPAGLNVKRLFEPHGSFPGNPLIAEPLYLTKYIERLGTGIRDMIDRCRAVGLPQPEFSISDGFVAIIRRKPQRAFEAVGGKGRSTGEVAGVVTGEVTGEVRKVMLVCDKPMARKQLQERLVLKGEENFRKLYLVPALESGYIEMTIPDKPNSRLQKYRLTDKGRRYLEDLDRK